MLSLQVSVGDVGEIFKVRLEHDNSGSFPAWRPSQVRKSFARDRETRKLQNYLRFSVVNVRQSNRRGAGVVLRSMVGS